jgi:hypothetical protein
MATKYTNIFHGKTLKNNPKRNFGLKICHLAILADFDDGSRRGLSKSLSSDGLMTSVFLGLGSRNSSLGMLENFGAMQQCRIPKCQIPKCRIPKC